MDSLNPIGLSQKELEIKLEKLNCVHNIIKKDEGNIEKMEEKLKANTKDKNEILEKMEKMHE